MPASPFRTVAPGSRPRAGDYNRLTDGVANTTNPTGGNQATGPGVGTHKVPEPGDYIWARITGSYIDDQGQGATNCEVFLYEEVEDDHCELTYREGVSMNLEQPPDEVEPRFPAYSLDHCPIEPGTIVQLWRGVGPWFHFLTPAQCSQASGSSGFSGFSSGSGDSGGGKGGGGRGGGFGPLGHEGTGV